ncbi:lanC-like protein 3 [Lycorma delicatula]|uniref:lanC-like protein 3 n=1 Tax=Lycorma delicatula TaxID=130591 RepID=UPI003F510315
MFFLLKCFRLNFSSPYEVICVSRKLPPFLHQICNFSLGVDNEIDGSMYSPKRYFVNELQDYETGSISPWEGDKLTIEILNLVNQINLRQPALEKFGDGGLYVGIAGIAYMYYYLYKHPAFRDQKVQFLSKGIEYIKQAEKYLSGKPIRDPADETGFLLGGSGVHAVAACLYKSAGEKEAMEYSILRYTAAGVKCKKIHFLPYGGDELLVGRAGYISGALWLKKVFGTYVLPIEDIIDVCRCVYESGIEYSKRHNSPSRLMYSYYDTEYLGAAHGLSTILQMLMSVPEFLKQYPDSEHAIRQSVDFMLSLQTPDGNFPCAMDEVGNRVRPVSEELVHWCHGAPGVVYLMAKAYLLWQDVKYLKSCLKCGELIWEKGLLKKGPGICHGVAGNGYVFLLLYRLTGDKKHLFRAQQFAKFIFCKRFTSARKPDNPYSLYEGFAGTVCFLADLILPEKASFPFLDVY